MNQPDKKADADRGEKCVKDVNPPSSLPDRSAREPLAAEAQTMPQNASADPTDRSMPAVRITKVMPTARIPKNETARMMFRNLVVVPEAGFEEREEGDHQEQEDDRRKLADQAGVIDAALFLADGRGSRTRCAHAAVTFPCSAAAKIAPESSSWRRRTGVDGNVVLERSQRPDRCQLGRERLSHLLG